MTWDDLHRWPYATLNRRNTDASKVLTRLDVILALVNGRKWERVWP